MKKISRFAAILFLVASFTTPVFAFAAGGTGLPGSSCGSDGQCSQGTCVGMSGNPPSGTCSTTGSTGVSGTSGSGINTTYLKGYSDSITSIINTILVPVLIAISFIVFLWGVFNYFIYGADDEAKRKEGRQFVMWGVIGLVIIFSVWALVNIVTGTLFPSTISNIAPTPPKL